ncbi:MAG TPA: hypothetical protein VFO73_05890, partial [Candidatus Limnocylindrales bacterium]|nr:hypothetical protein [Candidatus Limnocylindrales bacterium]
MLRPTRRHGRLSALLFGGLVASLVLPIGTVAGSPASPAASTSAVPVADAPPAGRTPRLEGRGVQAFDAGRGQKPKEPLQDLEFDPTADTPTATAPSGPLAVTAAPPATLATSSGAPAATSFGPWEGLDQAGAAAICPTGASCAEREPPDASVAVGPNDVVQTVNTDLRFTTREGTVTKTALDAYEFFKVATFTFEDQLIPIDGISDPRWVYDAKHDRWFGTITAWHCDDDGAGEDDDGYGFVLAALSATNSPTGGYYHFSIRYDLLPVGAMIGTSGDKIVLSASEYYLDATTCTGSLQKDTPSLLTLGWADLMTFPAFPAFRYTLLLPFESTLEAPRPAISPKGTSNTIYGVLADDVTGTTSNVVYFTITGTISQSVNDITVETSDLTDSDVVPPFESPPAPVQPGGTLPSAVTRHPTHAIWQDDVLTFAATYPCNPGSGTRACARVTQLDTTTPTPTRIQDMLIGTNGKDTWMPGVAQSQNGTLHAVFTQSSSTGGMSSYTRYQLPSDALNTLSDSVELADGGANHYDGTRWGDFTLPAQDPRDSNAVWQGNQYTKSDGSWGTRVSELQTAGATFVPIDPVRVLDSRDGTGLSNPFNANLARSVQVAGVGVIPDDAVAITGNLTVTQQQAAGFLAATPTPNNAPSTSTLNFPLGDTRANNITSPLATDGKLS